MMSTGWMKAAYAVLLVASALFSVLYLGAFSVLLFLILLILPVFMLISVFCIKFSLKASVETTGSTYHRNTPQAVRLIVNNRGLLPVGKMSAAIVCTSHVTGEQIPITLCFPVPARNVTVVEFTISVPHCGLTTINVKKLKFTDYIRLFAGRVKCRAQASVMILPTGTELDYELMIPGSETDEESNLYSKLKAGDDPSEVYRIREYQPGDLQKRIHWKLSSRTDTVWVKEYSFPISHRGAVIADYTVSNTKNLDNLDTSLEAVYTISTALIKQEIPVTLYWFDSSLKQLLWNELHSMSELNDCMEDILSEKPSESSDELLEQISLEHSIHSTNAVYFCTPSADEAEYSSIISKFAKNRIFVITAQEPVFSHDSSDNILHVHESNMYTDLKKLSAASEVMGE